LFILNADSDFSWNYFDINYSLGSYFECAIGNNGTNVSKMKFISRRYEISRKYKGEQRSERLQGLIKWRAKCLKWIQEDMQ